MQSGSAKTAMTEGSMLKIFEETGELWCGFFIWPLCIAKSIQLQLVAGWYLTKELGWHYLIVVTVICIVFIGTSSLNDLLKDERDAKNKQGEANATLLSEIFNNLKMLKLYGWQDNFHKRLADGCAKENDMLQKLKKKESWIGQIEGLLYHMFSISTLLVFVMNGNTLTVTHVIVLQSYLGKSWESFDWFPHFKRWMEELH